MILAAYLFGATGLLCLAGALTLHFMDPGPGRHARQDPEDTQTSIWLAGLHERPEPDPFPAPPWQDSTGSWKAAIAAEEATS